MLGLGLRFLVWNRENADFREVWPRKGVWPYAIESSRGQG